jgi:glutaconate CoA-transferase subunit A
MGLPFMAVHGIHGTDYEGIRKDFLRVSDPYSGEDIIVVPSINPDFCIIHAVKSDPHGNLVIPGSDAFRLAALSSRITIATVEEVVEGKAFIARRGQTFLSALHVDLVVSQPLGAHPTLCPGVYPADEEHIKLYVEHAQDEKQFQKYLDTYVRGMSEEEYVEKVGKKFFENALS